jgi:hypothetical protein
LGHTRPPRRRSRYEANGDLRRDCRGLQGRDQTNLRPESRNGFAPVSERAWAGLPKRTRAGAERTQRRPGRRLSIIPAPTNAPAGVPEQTRQARNEPKTCASADRSQSDGAERTQPPRRCRAKPGRRPRTNSRRQRTNPWRRADRSQVVAPKRTRASVEQSPTDAPNEATILTRSPVLPGGAVDGVAPRVSLDRRLSSRRRPNSTLRPNELAPAPSETLPYTASYEPARMATHRADYLPLRESGRRGAGGRAVGREWFGGRPECETTASVGPSSEWFSMSG